MNSIPKEITSFGADHRHARPFWERRDYLRENRWVRLWTRREIQAFTQEEDVEVIVRRVLGSIESFRRNEIAGSKSSTATSDPEAKRREFKVLVSEAAGEFLGERSGLWTSWKCFFLLA